MLQLERRLSTAAGQVADQMLLVQLTRAHADASFIVHACFLMSQFAISMTFFPCASNMKRR
jgi:hypothetical protein